MWFYLCWNKWICEYTDLPQVTENESMTRKYDEFLKLVIIIHSSIYSPLVLSVLSTSKCCQIVAWLPCVIFKQSIIATQMNQSRVLFPNKQKIMLSSMKIMKFAARLKQWLSLILMSLIKSRYMSWYCWTIVAKQMVRIILREKTEKAIGKILNEWLYCRT